jgi:hypothetical protein
MEVDNTAENNTAPNTETRIITEEDNGNIVVSIWNAPL